MSDRAEAGQDDDLIESQGVNAGPPIDREPQPPAQAGAEPVPPSEPDVPGIMTDEMAGLPEQRPDAPGQQRSIDTS